MPRISQSQRATMVLIYARVSTADQRPDLKRQIERLTQVANDAGLNIADVVTEVGSGASATRKRLGAALRRNDWGVLLVERRDRLSRTGFEWFKVLLEAHGRRVTVVEETPGDVAEIADDLVSIIYSLSTQIHGVEEAHQRTGAAISALGLDHLVSDHSDPGQCPSLR